MFFTSRRVRGRQAHELQTRANGVGAADGTSDSMKLCRLSEGNHYLTTNFDFLTDVCMSLLDDYLLLL